MNQKFKYKYILVFSSLFLVSFLLVNAQTSPENLFNVDVNTVALWRFNEPSSNIAIDETGINNGTAIGTSIIDGKFGKARYFNGVSDYIIVPNNPSLNNLSQITIEAWVYPQGFDLGCWNQNESIIFKGVETPPAIIDYALRIDRNIDTWCGSATSFRQLKFSGQFSGVNISSEIWHDINQWYYVVFVYDGNYLNLYINGILEATSNYVPNLILPSTAYPLYINHHTWNYGFVSSQRIQGLIDEIRISNIARSAQEIAYYYNLVGSYPSEFWTEIQNAPLGGLNLRKTAGSANKPVDDIIKALPNGWALKVASTTDENGNYIDKDYIDKDGYRWYEVEDITDGTIGWMAGLSFQDKKVYLAYNQATQTDLQRRAEEQLDTKEKRIPIILDSVSAYYDNINTSNSLYGTGGGKDDNNTFQKFITGALFPKEIILAITAQESGPDFNNEVCSRTKDGGIGIMQITSVDFKGIGSGLDNYSKKNDCNAKTGWVGDFSKYYSNTLQGIYANIKDGFRVLQEKYRQKCPKESITIDGYEFSCQDIEKILTTWGYNGFAKDRTTGIYTGNYLKYIADKLEIISSYFSGIIYANADYLIEKLRIANNHKIIVKLYSPAELQIIDSQGRMTGLFEKTTKEEIPNSMYDRDNEGAAIFFPYDSYRYRVVGVSNGIYGLSIYSTDNGTSTAFNAIDIPIVANEAYQYVIDWGALSRGEKGVTVEVDKNGDGIFDYQFKSSNVLHDTEKPETKIILNGVLGNNNWYTSDVQLVLSAQDNEGGTGVLKTEYLLDNGATWIIYTNPFTIHQEEINTILYRSQDFLGNLEDVKTVEIKIDKTSPEAKIYFDKDNRVLRIEGIDNLSQTTTTQHNNVFTIQDEAGHFLNLDFDELKQQDKEIKAELESLQYDNSLIIQPPETELKYEWSLDKDKTIQELEQRIKVENQFEIKAKYNRQKDKTEIEIKYEGEEKIKYQLPGLVIIKLTTKSGALDFEF